MLLIFFVWIWLYVERLSIIQKRKINPQALADAVKADELLRDGDRSSENFENLFEIPTLFFIGAIVAYVLNVVDLTYVLLGSIFVALRYVHTIIHCSYNRIMHRFTVYALSTIVLWIFWFRLGAQIIW